MYTTVTTVLKSGVCALYTNANAKFYNKPTKCTATVLKVTIANTCYTVQISPMHIQNSQILSRELCIHTSFSLLESCERLPGRTTRSPPAFCCTASLNRSIVRSFILATTHFRRNDNALIGWASTFTNAARHPENNTLQLLV